MIKLKHKMNKIKIIITQINNQFLYKIKTKKISKLKIKKLATRLIVNIFKLKKRNLENLTLTS